jgi:hypothetical protein
MIRKLSALLTLTLLTLAPLHAQTNAPPVITVITNQMGPAPATEASFIQTAFGYFTSFNPDLAGTFTNRGTVWAGVASIVGGPSGEPSLENELGVSYALGKGFAPELVLRNANVAGTVDSLQGGLSYGLVLIDTRVAAYADGGYDWNLSKMYGEVGLRVQKALTAHTFAGVSYGVQILGTKGSPPQVLGAEVGFTF